MSRNDPVDTTMCCVLHLVRKCDGTHWVGLYTGPQPRRKYTQVMCRPTMGSSKQEMATQIGNQVRNLNVHLKAQQYKPSYNKTKIGQNRVFSLILSGSDDAGGSASDVGGAGGDDSWRKCRGEPLGAWWRRGFSPVLPCTTGSRPNS